MTGTMLCRTYYWSSVGSQVVSMYSQYCSGEQVRTYRTILDTMSASTLTIVLYWLGLLIFTKNLIMGWSSAKCIHMLGMN